MKWIEVLFITCQDPFSDRSCNLALLGTSCGCAETANISYLQAQSRVLIFHFDKLVAGMLFFSYMVEDKAAGPGILSYVEFLVHVHRQIQTKMAWMQKACHVLVKFWLVQASWLGTEYTTWILAANHKSRNGSHASLSCCTKSLDWNRTYAEFVLVIFDIIVSLGRQKAISASSVFFTFSFFCSIDISFFIIVKRCDIVERKIQG